MPGIAAEFVVAFVPVGVMHDEISIEVLVEGVNIRVFQKVRG